MNPAVLLISPGILKWTDLDFGLPHLVSMGGWLQEHTGVRVEILDLNYEGKSNAELARTIDELGPFLVIGLSTYSSFDRMRTLTLARFLKDRYPDVPLVTGGYHASAVPDDLLFDGSPFDAVVLGEGERPMQKIVEILLGGERLESDRYGPDLIQDLDTLPPYRWELLRRYWPRATTLGRKLQVYLSRGCIYHCTFCMERAKSGYSWRAYSPERAVDELRRLASITDLSHWVVNIADPLFGFKRRWRRQVLEGIIEHELFPRQYWTLTRSDDLSDVDVSLLARARFSIGIGLESGSPTMLEHMEKGNKPGNYLDAVRRMAALSHDHGMNWAVNVIVGHPGETPQTAKETHDFVTSLFSGPETRGWLSIDPFRLYPGSYVHETMDDWERRFGAHFYHRDWWRSWYDEGFLAQHLDPSSELDYAARVRWQFDTYGPLVRDISERFVGQGRSVDRVYETSMRGQITALSSSRRDLLIARGAEARVRERPEVRVPLGLRMKDPWVRRRENAVRRLLDAGTLRSEPLIEALLEVGPEDYMSADDAKAVLDDRPLSVAAEGTLPAALGISLVATGLEALEPDEGLVVADLTARTGWVAALLRHLVGPDGDVIARTPADLQVDDVEVQPTDYGELLVLDRDVDRVWIGAALPRVPRGISERLRPNGRVVAAVGPRYRNQDFVVVARKADGVLDERLLGKVRIPVLADRAGWMRRPAGVRLAGGTVRFARRRAPALCYAILAHLDLGNDAANLFRPGLSADWAPELRAAYLAAPGRLAVQVSALAHDSVDDWLAALRTRPPAPLLGGPGRALTEALCVAIEAEKDVFEGAWPDERCVRRVAETASGLQASLTRLRQRLWDAQPTPPPPLLVLDCPALGRAGRATTVGGERVVAVSFAAGPDHVLCQVLHEEVHPITDPVVRAQSAIQGPRSTSAADVGYALHMELEHTCIDATEAFLGARAPELLPDFRRWKAHLAL